VPTYRNARTQELLQLEFLRSFDSFDLTRSVLCGLGR